MKRTDLLNAIDELKVCDDIAHAIDALRDVAVNFCDNAETDFNNIRDVLDDLAPHIDKVQEAHSIAEKCGINLY